MTDRRWQLRSARDFDLSPSDRLRSLRRERGLGSTLTSLVWRAMAGAYLWAIHWLDIEGRENLPPPPFVLIANHASHLDALSLSAALPLRADVFALAAGDTFFSTGLRAAFAAYAVNALPIWRKQTSLGDLATLRERLSIDASVFILFPEGTRSRTGVMGRFKPGIGAIVAGTPISIVPCYLRGAGKAWPPGQRWPWPGKLRLTIGPPLRFEAQIADRQGMAAIARQCEEAVRQLAPEGQS